MPNENVRKFFENTHTQGLRLTFGDIRLESHFSDVVPADPRINLHSRFSRRIPLIIPLVSSPMDTVTEAAMAIEMAQAGGLGIIHRGLSPEAQAREVGRVKNRVHGRVFTPITASPGETVEEFLARREKKQWQFHTFPVVDANNVLLGVVTGNDFEYCTNPKRRICDIMTPFEELLKADPTTDPEKAFSLMKEHRKKTLPLVDDKRQLTGLYVFSDLKRIHSGERSPHNLDAKGRLRVAAAVGVGEGAVIRARNLAGEGCDAFVIDTAHGASSNVHATIRELKRSYPDIDVIAGNVSNGPTAKGLAEAGADGILVGQGPGSICTTRIVAGIGVPQVSAVYACTAALEDAGLDVPVIADGGITNSGDIVIALAVGASCVVLGRMLAGTDENPGDIKDIDGKPMKPYRGMGSPGAMRDNTSSRERYGQGNDPAKTVAEGVEGMVPYRGSVSLVIEQIAGGIRSSMGYHGTHTLKELVGAVQPFRMTLAGLNESHVHDIHMIVTPPNYRR